MSFFHFSVDKVTSTRALISPFSYDPSICVPCLAVFNQVEPVSLSFFKRHYWSYEAFRFPCGHYPSPRLSKEILTTIGPLVLAIVNSSLTSSVVPAVFKHAVVQPLLKKTGLDPSLYSNFGPISKLPFFSKILEKIVVTQLIPFLDKNGIFEVFQSGFKAHTEMAL